jgi:hybrid cluster-associated redox disulfide protein
MERKQISLQSSVAELLSRWPEAIPVFLEYKLNCVGCSMSDFETLADAIEIYQLPREQFIDDLEQAIQNSAGE